MRDKILLKQLQMLPLDAKILMTQQRIREWYNYWNGNVCISFSGGKDSTVLTHIVRSLYPNVPLVFANTGLEYPEIQAFAREMGAEFVRPKMSFPEVISTYGYPIISKEVAEAISFARRIVQHNDGKDDQAETEKNDSNELSSSPKETILHYERSRLELHGERDDTERIRKRSEMSGGGVRGTSTRKGRMEKSKPHRKHTSTQGRKGRNYKEDGRTRRELRKVRQARRWLMGKN